MLSCGSSVYEIRLQSDYIKLLTKEVEFLFCIQKDMNKYVEDSRVFFARFPYSQIICLQLEFQSSFLICLDKSIFDKFYQHNSFLNVFTTTNFS